MTKTSCTVLAFTVMFAGCEIAPAALKLSPADRSAPSARSVRAADEDPDVRIELSVDRAIVGPGEMPTVTATIYNHGSVPLTVSADEYPGRLVRLVSLAFVENGGAGHRPVAMVPARLQVPPGESRRARVRDPADEGDNWVRWAPGTREVVVHYSTPPAPRDATSTDPVRWSLVDDGSAAGQRGRLQHVELSASVTRIGSRARVAVSARSRELRPIELPRVLELEWIAHGELVSSETRDLGPLDPLRSLESRMLASLEVELPAAPDLGLRVGWRPPGPSPHLSPSDYVSIR